MVVNRDPIFAVLQPHQALLLVQLHFIGIDGHVAEQGLFEMAGQFRVVNDHAIFGVQIGRAWVHIE